MASRFLSLQIQQSSASSQASPVPLRTSHFTEHTMLSYAHVEAVPVPRMDFSPIFAWLSPSWPSRFTLFIISSGELSQNPQVGLLTRHPVWSYASPIMPLRTFDWDVLFMTLYLRKSRLLEDGDCILIIPLLSVPTTRPGTLAALVNFDGKGEQPHG